MAINDLRFPKTGKDIKAAVRERRAQLEQRLEKRNKDLDSFLQDTKKVRSYLVRSTQPNYSHGGGREAILFGQDDISSEERRETDQLCQRIFEIEQELHRLSILVAHLDDQQIVNLTLEDLINYGFQAGASVV